MTETEIEKLRAKVRLEIENDIELLIGVLLDASEIACKRGYDCTGWNALYVIFAEKFAWSPEKVRSLTVQELSWLLETSLSD